MSKRCESGCVDNEHHFIFKCKALADVRRKYRGILKHHKSATKLMEMTYHHDTAFAVTNCIHSFITKLKHIKIASTGRNAGQM